MDKDSYNSKNKLTNEKEISNYDNYAKVEIEILSDQEKDTSINEEKEI